LVSILFEGLDNEGLELEDGDIIAITSKVVSVVQNRLVRYNTIVPSEKARELASRYNLEPGFIELVLRESDKIYGGVYRALLTSKDGILFANAGIDHKNVPEGIAVLLPENSDKVADEIRREIKERVGKNIGVIITDSRTVPLRMGTIGVAVGVSGFNPIRDCREKLDFYGKPLLITRMALADDLASAAHIVMGEITERIPIVLIRGAPVEFDETATGDTAKIPHEDCLYMRIFQPRSL
jgi:coenzyme F420-0:L-glutamate ligase